MHRLRLSVHYVKDSIIVDSLNACVQLLFSAIDPSCLGYYCGLSCGIWSILQALSSSSWRLGSNNISDPVIFELLTTNMRGRSGWSLSMVGRNLRLG